MTLYELDLLRDAIRLLDVLVTAKADLKIAKESKQIIDREINLKTIDVTKND